MRKILIALTVLLSGMAAQAQLVPGLDRLNIFNHLGVGVSASTNGVGIEVGTTITNFVEMRAGVSIMPGFGFHTDADVSFEDYYHGPNTGFDAASETVQLDASFKRVQGSLIFNVYPGGKKFPLFIAVGGYFGGNKLVNIKGHVNPETLNMIGNNPFVEIGDYQVDFDKNGDIKADLRVNKFRPYIGIGTGHFIPKRRINFSWEIGVQFHGHPKIYANDKELKLDEIMGEENDDSFQKIMDKITVWPVLKFTLSGRIF